MKVQLESYCSNLDQIMTKTSTIRRKINEYEKEHTHIHIHRERVGYNNHFAIHQKLLQHCKSTIFLFKMRKGRIPSRKGK